MHSLLWGYTWYVYWIKKPVIWKAENTFVWIHWTTYQACSKIDIGNLGGECRAHIHGCTGHGYNEILGTKAALVVHNYQRDASGTVSVMYRPMNEEYITQNYWIINSNIWLGAFYQHVVFVFVSRHMLSYIIRIIAAKYNNNHLNFSHSDKCVRWEWSGNAHISHAWNILWVM